MLNQKGVVHLLVPVILLIGLIAGVYLITSGNPLKLFSKAANPPIVFKNTDGSALPVNSNNIPQTASPTVRIEFTSTLEAIATATPTPIPTPSYAFCDANQDGAVNSTDGTFVKGCWNKQATGECKKADLDNSGKVTVSDIQKFSYRCAQIFATPTPAAKPAKPAKPATRGIKGVSIAGNVGIGWTGPTFKYAENPTDLDAAAYIPYFAPTPPMVVDYTFKDSTPGQKFIWVEFKTPDGRTDRRSAQIEIISSPISAPISPTPQPAKRVFVTSTTYNGNLGGLAGADVKCQARADAANLGGTWKAWLTDDTTTAALRLNHNSGPYQLLNGKLVANNWLDLIDGTIQNPININEFNQTRDREGWGVWIWTNTREDGTRMNAPSLSCNNWSSAASGVYGELGNNSSIDQYWTVSSSDYCSSSYSLYCFEQ